MSANSKIDWHRDSTTGVEWFVGVPYCECPADDAYQTLGILVPGSLAGSPDAASEAPIVMPVVTEGYAAMGAPTESDLPALIEAARPFLDAGMVYVRAGCRGRLHGAPAGVTDLKAVVRWLRAHDEVPGNKDLVFAFGHSGGGAQTAVLGASGNSDLWAPYLEAIGACDESDAIAGAMCWNPVTSLGVADAAYEWMMGRFCREGAELERSLELAATYPDYLRKLGYEEGEYVQVLLDVATKSLRNWLADGRDREVDAAWGWIAQGPAGPVVSDLAGFVRDRKRPTKPSPAFDRDDLKSPENMLFGHDGEPLHFGADYVDFFGTSQSDRVAMYDPLTYLLAGGASSDVAPFWRVSTGLIQPDTALCTEVNLAEATRRCPATRDVRFQTVWDVAHVKAERCGAPEENVIRWIREVLGR
ncbi:hypothetical protein [Paratractidigestivibacter sp.]|uniref:hypothetical protein n=1 Tax=Paratractidigestivibacter sp. TaxID=2847316 RepID=UPI002ABE556A|nr:hypothetical protein [Paratractidigestivibacter sp.]